MQGWEREILEFLSCMYIYLNMCMRILGEEGLETRRFLRSLQTQTILWFYHSMIWWYNGSVILYLCVFKTYMCDWYMHRHTHLCLHTDTCELKYSVIPTIWDQVPQKCNPTWSAFPHYTVSSFVFNACEPCSPVFQDCGWGNDKLPADTELAQYLLLQLHAHKYMGFDGIHPRELK